MNEKEQIRSWKLVIIIISFTSVFIYVLIFILYAIAVRFEIRYDLNFYIQDNCDYIQLHGADSYHTFYTWDVM